MHWHLLALLTACIWGSTFAASSLLIKAGLSPAEIMSLRFAVAYLLMLPFEAKGMVQHAIRYRQSDRSARRVRWRDEGLFILLGITGGSLYFLTENYAVKLTSYTSTVALIVSTCPILTAFIHRLLWRGEHLSSRFLLGSSAALTGVTLVVLNGVFVLDDNPWVILLSFGAALSWAFYSIILKLLDRRYASDVITRKVFFWGIVTMLPVCWYESVSGHSLLLDFGHTVTAPETGWWGPLHIEMLTSSAVAWPLLYLSFIASLGCFLVWNIVCKRITVVVASNYLYFNPVTSLLAGAILLDERITWPAIIGCIVTIAGVYLCNTKLQRTPSVQD
ncbi:MAG: DMT family transporter [Bacteroidales bacterium]|nr:DMT family transporter [Bacteroidales bacterium]